MRLSGISTIKRRKDFLLAKDCGASVGGFGMFLQVVKDPRGILEGDAVRVGFTVSKKVGKAVVRNKVKRRFRALARDVLVKYANKGYCYVLIGNRYTPKISFKEMSSRLIKYLNTPHLYS
ncbi:MAG: ribonuclease P protein component [Ehrlichia sp.]